MRLSLRWSAVRFAPSKLLLDHLRKLVVAIVVLEDLDQLGFDRT
jgi:hypothetical protein